MNAKTALRYAACAVLILLLASAPTLEASNYDSKADSSVSIDFTDGPHVFWQSDTNAIVFYLLDNQLEFGAQLRITHQGRLLCKNLPGIVWLVCAGR